jgi:ElaB/YqjD/DUF883 family membrane-anchored ribosome-binding protein
MSEATETIRQDIATIRDSMTDKMEQIESKVRGTVDTTVETVGKIFDLKQQVGEHPWAALGLAALTGYLLGSVGGASEPAPRPGDAVRYYVDDPKARAASSGQQLDLIGEISEQFGSELQVITAAATAAAMSMLRDTIKESLPQFGQAYEKASGTAQEEDPSIGGLHEESGYRSDPTEINPYVPLRDPYL